MNPKFKMLTPEKIKALQNDKRDSYFEMQRILDKTELPNKSMKKLIFLDIDGVLNNESLLRQNIFLCPTKVSLLSTFCKYNNIDIVISSSWREVYCLDELKSMLYKEGFVNIDSIIDVTPVGKDLAMDKTAYIFRGYEIENWLNKQAVQYNYVILDDTPDFLDFQKDRFVLTDFNEGLDIKHLRKMLKIFNSNSEG